MDIATLLKYSSLLKKILGTATKVYSLHRQLLKNYFENNVVKREEQIILGEYKYEKERMQKAIINMYCKVAKEEKGCLILDEVNKLIEKGERSKSAIEIVASTHHLKKNYVYDLYIKNK